MKHFKEALTSILQGNNLATKEMTELMHSIMNGEASDIQIAAILVALCTKGESQEEIVAAANVMRSLSTKVMVEHPDELIDIVGCGDGSSTLNISTCCAFICATAGIPVAKHGNRSNTSVSGASDVLATAGLNLDLSPKQVAMCIKHHNIGFLFAPKYHTAMHHAINVRQALGVRTLFNLLGPLTNPAGVKNQVVGVFSTSWVTTFAEVLNMLGSHHAIVVHSRDGLDEISIADITDVAELKDDTIRTWTINPSDYACRHASLDEAIITSAEESLRLMRKVLAGEKSVASDMVVLNAAAALYVGKKTHNYADGVEYARNILQSGKALEKFDQFIAYTQSF